MDRAGITVGPGMDMPIMHDSDRYELVKDIGSGNFGVARLMMDKQSKELVAVKYIERGEKCARFVERWSVNKFRIFKGIKSILRKFKGEERYQENGTTSLNQWGIANYIPHRPNRVPIPPHDTRNTGIGFQQSQWAPGNPFADEHTFWGDNESDNGRRFKDRYGFQDRRRRGRGVHPTNSGTHFRNDGYKGEPGLGHASYLNGNEADRIHSQLVGRGATITGNYEEESFAKLQNLRQIRNQSVDDYAGTTTATTTTTTASRATGSGLGICYNCGKTGHMKRECPNLRKHIALLAQNLHDHIDEALQEMWGEDLEEETVNAVNCSSPLLRGGELCALENGLLEDGVWLPHGPCHYGGYQWERLFVGRGRRFVVADMEDSDCMFEELMILKVDELDGGEWQVCHRDLKLENTLLDGSPAPRLKICDFGYSKSLVLHSQPKSTVGTPAYIAPEVLLRKEYDGKIADVWSCGVTLYVMLVGAYPFEDSEDPKNFKKTIQRILSVQYSIPDYVHISLECRHLISRIFVADPSMQKTPVISLVYGPIDKRDKPAFWEELSDIRCMWDDPWGVGGDFTVIRFSFQIRALVASRIKARYTSLTCVIVLPDSLKLRANLTKSKEPATPSSGLFLPCSKARTVLVYFLELRAPLIHTIGCYLLVKLGVDLNVNSLFPELVVDICCTGRISIPEIWSHEWFVKNLPNDLMKDDNPMNNQFQAQDQATQSVDDIMLIIAEATVPDPRTRSINQFLMDLGDEDDMDLESEPDIDVDSSGELIYAM
ncbi:hypothetical protein GIB67_029603 [Kingdonia uniflora]|uniref:non-specific serine/threonine protein kinase n=1 Tax=Kingdonia uniflora TaxID=39325 RepID=A0A7J7LLQ8_9MAGN|nr:hypothetical protein GIB67_029603 [Kingdonia uniflora]